MNTFSNEVKSQALDMLNGYCYNCYNKAHSIHHKLPNTKPNRKNYPIFIHSIFNAVPLCDYCHREYPHKFHITEKEAVIYENYLQELKGE